MSILQDAADKHGWDKRDPGCISEPLKGSRASLVRSLRTTIRIQQRQLEEQAAEIAWLRAQLRES